MKKRIVLIGYPAEYFLKFGNFLTKEKFDIYWVVFLNADYKFLLKNNIDKNYICFANYGFSNKNESIQAAKEYLATIEREGQPKCGNLIQMDRNLRTMNDDFSYRYLSHIGKNMEHFLKVNRISLATTWRDTAPQLLGMLVCKSLCIQIIIPTRLRIPNDLFGFSCDESTESFIPLRERKLEDEIWAKDFLKEFDNGLVKAELKIATRSFLDVMKLIPNHLSAFGYNARRAFYDFGNKWNRYTIPQLIKKYFKRRFYLIQYKILKPYEKNFELDDKFMLYALHTQPESSIDVQASFFSNQIELIRNIAKSIPSNYYLFVKVHPTDVDGKNIKFYKTINAIPGVKLLNYDVPSSTLVEKASIIFALTGTIAYESALRKKNVIVFTRNFFNGFPTVRLCKDIRNLSTIIEEMLNKTDFIELDAQIISKLADLRSCCIVGSPARVYGASNEPLRDTDMIALKNVYVNFIGQFNNNC
jgi:hypothetical protein